MTDQRPAWAIRLHDERIARGWGPFETARQLREAVGITRHPTDGVKNLAKQVTRHEKGHTRPRDWATAYATIYDVPEDELFPPPPPQPVAPRAGTVDHDTTPDVGDDDVKRRAALQLLTALSAGTAVPPGALETLLSDIDRIVSLNSDIDEWERVVYNYGHQIYRQPTDKLLSALTADTIAVGKLLRTGRSRDDQAGLLRVSAGLSGVMAEALGNTGDERAARRSWYTARRAADASGDRILRVWVRARAAQHASWADGSHRAVMDLVNEAIEISGGTPSSGLARAHAAGAYMAAFQGDRRTALDSLDMLKRTFDQLPHSSREPTVLEFQESQLSWNEAYVRTILSDRRAVSAVEDAQTLYPPSALAPITNLHLMRAFDLVQSGEIGEGLELAFTSLKDRPRPVYATRQLVGQIYGAVPHGARALPAARELEALAAGA